MTDSSLVKALGVTSPYPGLRPFRREESTIFFGREAQIDQMLQKLHEHQFLGVIGPSGCGKSSLVRAGLIAGLDAGFMPRGGTSWRIADLQPRNQPYERLADALLCSGALGETWPETDVRSRASLAASLRRGPRSLLNLWGEANAQEDASLLLLVDQFEEIFRFREHQDRNAALAFVNLLLESARQPELKVFVVLTMRSDFLGDCTVFPDLPEALNQGQFLTPQLTRAQVADAIESPASLFGAAVEPALVNRILNDLGEDPDHLPLTQHVLNRMWNLATRTAYDPASVRLSVDDYERIGGITQALSNHADEVFGRLAGDDDTEDEKRTARILFRHLSERRTQKRDTRRPAILKDVAEGAGIDSAELIPVIDAFRNPGVLLPDSTA